MKVTITTTENGRFIITKSNENPACHGVQYVAINYDEIAFICKEIFGIAYGDARI